MWLFRIDHHCHINGIKFQRLKGKGNNKRLLEAMEIAKNIGVENGKWFENLHLFAFGVSFFELATFQLSILCTLLSSLKFSRLFHHLIVLSSQLTC